MVGLKDKNIPYYKGNIKLSNVIGYVSLNQLVNSIKNPKKHIKEVIKKIRDKNIGSVEKRALKHKLYSVTVSALIPKHKKRSYNNIYRLNEFMQLDFDKLKYDVEDFKKEVFKNKSIICVFKSPSGNGVKAIARINRPKNVEDYKKIHNAFKDTLTPKMLEFFDNATKNAVLPMFISYDENILYRNFNKCVEFCGRKETEENTYKVVNIEATKYVPNNNNKEKTIRIFKTKIGSIIGNGHPQVLNACLILGSRVAAGYIGYFEAENLVIQCISENAYLKKGTKGYIKTGITYLKKGYNNGARYY